MALKNDYPWLTPDPFLVACAPMLRIADANLATAVSAAGGFGFLAGGFDTSNLKDQLQQASLLASEKGIYGKNTILPIGVGFLNWGADLDRAIEALKAYPPAAVWLFAPREISDLRDWALRVRQELEGKTKIWIQVGTVAEAVQVAKTVLPDVLVVQGADAGGHGLQYSAGLITLLPEVDDALQHNGISGIPLIAAGGILDGRGAAAAMCLGAHGVAMGTRFLAAKETAIAKGYKDEIVRANDGGVNTVRSKVYDTLRDINDWPERYGGRGIINQSFLDVKDGVVSEENKALYKKAMQNGDAGWGVKGRMTTYAGTGIGLVTEVKTAKEIVQEILGGACKPLKSRI